MLKSLADRLDSQGFLLLDGALASELERRGCNLADPLWSAKVLLENPALIRQVHLDYLLAGADIITTASYQASFAGFARRGITAPQATALLQLSVQLALQARDDYLDSVKGEAARPLIAASVGPYGAVLANGAEYRGHYGLSVSQLMDFHRPRLAVLAASGADLLACETLPCPQEAEALVRLLREEFPETPAWISFSCRDEQHVSQGERLADCVAALRGVEQVVAAGINCTHPAHVHALLQSALPLCQQPLLVYPNAGEHWDASRHCWHGQTDTDEFVRSAKQWLQDGARLIGGCCRTGPEHIRALRQGLGT